MQRPVPHVGLMYVEDIPEQVFDAFKHAVSAPGLDFAIEKRERDGPFAGLEWLIPTSVMLYVTKGYFDGFLKEMGKDHYQVLKEGLKGLRQRFATVKVTLIGTPGKVSPSQPYSLFYSIYFASGEGQMFKFLVPNEEGAEGDADRIMDAFGDFLEAYYADELDPELKDMLARAPAFGGTVLVAYNPETGRVEPIHPVTKAFGLLPSP